MRKNVRVAALAAAGLTACGLPERDNAYDPSRSPSARLVVVDTGPEAGCGSEPATLVTAASRGRCLVLDASATTDPQDTPLADLSFTYSLEVDGGAPVVLATTSATFTLERSFKRAQPPGIPLTFRVTVTDPAGALGDATTTLTLENSPPRAAPLPPRTLPLGGFPGSSATHFDVPFDGQASSDPDFDDLSYRWTFRGMSTTAATTALVSQQVPVDVPARYLAELVVSDGDADSDPSIADLGIREPNVWTDHSAAAGVPEFRRIDSAREAVLLPDLSAIDASVHVAPYGDDLVVAAYRRLSDGQIRMSVLDRRTLAEVEGPLLLGGVAESIAVDGERSEAWVIERGSPRVLTRWSLSPLSKIGSHSLADLVIEADVDPIVSVDATGAAWAVARFGRGGLRVASDGTETAFATDDARWVSGIATRPGTQEIWMVEMPDAFTGTGSGNAELVRYSPGSAPIRHPIGSEYATGVAFASRDRAWVAVPDVGLHLVDIDALATSSFAESTLLIVPEVQDVLLLLADPVTGACWASAFTNVAYRVTRDGALTVLPARLNAIFFVDADGLAWHREDAIPIARGLAPSLDGTIARVPSAPPDDAAIDYATGGLWVVRLYPPSLLRFSEAGTLTGKFEHLVSENGAPISVPPLRNLRISSDGRYLWGRNVFSGAWFRVDLAAAPPTFVEAVVQPDAAMVGTPMLTTLDGSGVWAVNDGDTALLEIRPGTITTRATFVPGETPVLAVSPATGHLCVATRGAGATEVRIRTFAEGGSAPLRDRLITIDLNDRLVAAAAGADANGGDVCWVLLHRPSATECELGPAGETRVRAIRMSSGADVDGFTDLAAEGIELRMDAPDTVWMRSRRCDAGETVLVRTRYRRTPAGFVGHDFPTEDLEFLPMFSDP